MNWKGDAHTVGVYFDEKYAYAVERTYAVRMKHNEPATSVFYSLDDEEVALFFPYINLKKRPNKYELLFTESDLTPTEIRSLFVGIPDTQVTLPVQPLITLIESIPKKRDRDLTWLHLSITGTTAVAGLLQKKKEHFTLNDKMELKKLTNEVEKEIKITVNSNAFLHTLKLFSDVPTVLISILHDRIRVTNDAANQDIETVLSAPNKTIRKEIESTSIK